MDDVYQKLVADFFDKDQTAASFMEDDGSGSFLGASVKMAREIDKLRKGNIDYFLSVEGECKSMAISQWERSLKRSDLSERDRLLGAIDAYSRVLYASFYRESVK